MSRYLPYPIYISAAFTASAFYIAESNLALVHVSSIVFVSLCILSYILQKDRQPNFSGWLLAICIGMYLCYVFPMLIQHETSTKFFKVMNKKIWLVLYPLAFYLAQVDRIKLRLWAGISFLTSTVLMSIWTLYRSYEIQVKQGFYYWEVIVPMEVIPFKTHHHTLCILILDAIVISLILIYLYNQKKWVAYSLSVIVLFLGFTIHYVNARIGLIALYTFIILIVIYNLNKLKKYWWIATLVFIFLIGSLYFLPFISTRIKNSISEYKEQVLENKATLQSNMGVRILSQRVAIEILQHNIWKGIRPSEENKVYREGFQTYGREHHVEIPDLEDPYKPHNNFLRNAVIMGLPFGILFLTLFLSPLLRKEIYTSVFVTGLSLLISSIAIQITHLNFTFGFIPFASFCHSFSIPIHFNKKHKMKYKIQNIWSNNWIRYLIFIIIYSFAAIITVKFVQVRGIKFQFPLNAYQAMGIDPLNNYVKLSFIFLLGIIGGFALFLLRRKTFKIPTINSSPLSNKSKWIIHISMILLTILLAIWKPTDMGFGKIDVFHEGDFLAPAINHEHNKVAYKDYYFSHGFFNNVYIAHISYKLFGKSISSRRALESYLKISCYLLILFIAMGITNFNPYQYAPIILVFDILTFGNQFVLNRDLFFFSSLLIGIFITKQTKSTSKIILFSFLTFAVILTFYHSIDRGIFSLITLLSVLIIMSIIDKTILFIITTLISGYIFSSILNWYFNFSIIDIFSFVTNYLSKYYTTVYGFPFEDSSREANFYILVFVWDIACFFSLILSKYHWNKRIDIEFIKNNDLEIILIASSLATSITGLSRADATHLQYALAVPLILLLFNLIKWMNENISIYSIIIKYTTIVLFLIVSVSRGYIVFVDGYFRESFPMKPDNEYLNVNYLEAANYLKEEGNIGKKMYPLNSEVIWFYLTDQPCDCKFQMAIFYQPIQDQLIKCLLENKTEYIITDSDYGYSHFDNVLVKHRLSKAYDFVYEKYEPFKSFGRVVIYKRKNS